MSSTSSKKQNRLRPFLRGLETPCIHPLQATKIQIAELRAGLQSAINTWRRCQELQSPTIRSAILDQAPCEVETKHLFLPSHFSSELRESLGIATIAQKEAELREAQLCDAILQLRRAVKSLSAVRAAKKKNDSGQAQQTRSQVKIQTMEFIRNYHLAIYKLCRGALISLEGVDTGDRFPNLTKDDLYRKPTISKRERGATHRAEGGLWVTFWDFQRTGISDDAALQAREGETVRVEQRFATLVI